MTSCLGSAGLMGSGVCFIQEVRELRCRVARRHDGLLPLCELWKTSGGLKASNRPWDGATYLEDEGCLSTFLDCMHANQSPLLYSVRGRTRPHATSVVEHAVHGF